MRISTWAFTVLIAMVAVAYLAQATLAGQFLSGSYPALRLHQLVATGSDVLLFLAVAAGAVLRWGARGPIWPLLVALALLTANQVQNVAGAERWIWLHIPLGAAMLAAAVVTAQACMRPRAFERRP